jgi:DNA-binding winged helix-turn-helix (wHTH) protein
VASGNFRFDRFHLDPKERQLLDDGEPVELNSRYLDALALLVREQGRLVSKDRFLDEVWRGIPVTDEALTQCIKTLRRQLRDDAARPRFIETVPKHGYRFIAPVETMDGVVPAHRSAEPRPGRNWRNILLLGAGGTIGGGVAGLIGGLFYGFAGASDPLQPGMGAASVLLVMICLTILVGLIGAAGVSFGIAASGFPHRRSAPLTMLGGAAGGLVIGALTKLLGLDAFNLLFGQSPGDITGAMEGAILGAAVGLAAWYAERAQMRPRLRLGVATAAVSGGLAGALIPLLGGRLMGGSLALLTDNFANSRLRIEQVGRMVGEAGFGPVSQSVTGALEGALFAGCVVGAMVLALRTLPDRN